MKFVDFNQVLVVFKNKVYYSMNFLFFITILNNFVVWVSL